MKHKLTPQQYLTLLAVMVTASLGDALLSRGMSQLPPVDIHHLGRMLPALWNPCLILGTLLLIGFFASYMTALSWADLTFVLPATAFGNVIVAFLSRFWLHEPISLARWAGIALITVGVGFVTQGPSRTELPAEVNAPPEVAAR